MKTQIKLTIMGLFVAAVSLMPAAAVLAQVTEETPTQVQTTLEERLTQRKAALEERITEARLTRLTTRCTAAQSRIATHVTRISAIVDARQSAYETVITRLNSVVDNLKTHSVDTSALEAEITKFVTMTAAFEDNLTTYSQAVSDLVEMDCTGDVEGFHASLEEVRAKRTELVSSSSEIRAQVQDGIKPVLETLKVSLTEHEMTEEHADMEAN